MEAKKIVSLLLTLIIVIGMVSTFAVVGSASAGSLPTNTLIVKLGTTATDTAATYNGTEYSGLTFGTNLFATIQDAINAANEGDTILLCAGTYDETVYVSKNLTLKGAKAGIDPNGGAASATEEKTLTDGRSLSDATVETIVKGAWYMGYSAADTLTAADTTTITVDGVVFNTTGGMNSLIQNEEKTLNLSVKNCISVDVYNSFVYTCTGGSASADKYVRNLSFENIRFENYTRAYSYVFLRQVVDTFICDNIYFAATCTAKASQFISGWEISSRATAAEFTIKNSTFMVKGNQACFVDPALQFKSTSISLANLSEIKMTVENCKFVGSPAYTLFRPQFSQDHENVKITFSDNTVVSCTKPALWQNTGKKIAPTCYEIDNNTFINCNKEALISNLYVTAKATATKTLCVVDNVAIVPVGDATVEFTNNRMDVSGGGNTEVAKAISEIPSTIIATPVAGQKLSGVVLPDDAKYTASTVKWYDENNERVDTAKAGYTYKALFTLTILDTAPEWFENGVTTLHEGMTAVFADNKRSVDITYVYTVPGEKEPEPVVTDEPTDTTAVSETTDSPATEAPQEDGGCGSTIIGTGILAVTVSIIGTCIIKRKED